MANTQGDTLFDSPILIADHSSKQAEEKLRLCAQDSAMPNSIHKNAKGQIEQVDLPDGHKRNIEYDESGHIDKIIGACYRLDEQQDLIRSEQNDKSWGLYEGHSHEFTVHDVDKVDIDKAGNISMKLSERKSLILGSDGTIAESKSLDCLDSLYEENVHCK